MNATKHTHCIVCGSSEKPLFSLPKDHSRLSAWLHAINRADLLLKNSTYVYNNTRICQKHFPDWAFSSTLKTKLLKSAVPLQENSNDHSTGLNASMSTNECLTEFSSPPLSPASQKSPSEPGKKKLSVLSSHMADQQHEDPDGGGILGSDHPILKKYHIKQKGEKLYVIGPGANEDDESGWTALTVDEIEAQIQNTLRGFFNDPEKNPILKMKNDLLEEIEKSDRVTDETKELYRCLESTIRSQERELRRIGVIPKIPQRSFGVQIDMPVLPEEVIPHRFMQKAMGLRKNCQQGSSASFHQPHLGADSQPGTSSSLPHGKAAGNAGNKEIVFVDLADSDEEGTAPTNVSRAPNAVNSSMPVNQPQRPTQRHSIPLGGHLPIPRPPVIKLEAMNKTNDERQSYDVKLSWNVPNPENIRHAAIEKYEIVGYRKQEFEVFNPNCVNPLGSVHALPLPMICSLQNVELHSTFYLTVRLMDVHGRFSTYSNHLRLTADGR